MITSALRAIAGAWAAGDRSGVEGFRDRSGFVRAGANGRPGSDEFKITRGFPNGWREVMLADLMAILGGGVRSPKDSGKECCRACWIMNHAVVLPGKTVPISPGGEAHFRSGRLSSFGVSRIKMLFRGASKERADEFSESGMCRGGAAELSASRVRRGRSIDCV